MVAIFDLQYIQTFADEKRHKPQVKVLNCHWILLALSITKPCFVCDWLATSLQSNTEEEEKHAGKVLFSSRRRQIKAAGLYKAELCALPARLWDFFVFNHS